MKRTLISLILCSLVAVAAFAQAGPSKPADTPTADQILDKYVQGLGGKAALEKFNSTASKGTFEIPAFGATGSARAVAGLPREGEARRRSGGRPAHT